MTADALIEIAQQGLYLLVLLVAPPVGAAMAAGLAVGVLQTATQIQEQTISFAAKAAAVIAALVFAGPWIGLQLQTFTTTVIQAIAQVGAS